MAIDNTIPAWPYQPDWSQIVRERIEHRTDGIEAEDGSVQTRATRITPRRSFEYLLGLVGTDRQTAANLAWSFGAKRFYLPLWTDGLSLLGRAGATITVAATAGYDFAPGQAVCLQGARGGPTELAELSALTGTTLTLTAAPALPWAPGDVIYPARRALLDDAFSQSAFMPGVGYGTIRWLVDEPNPYPSVPPPDSYLGFPVLTTRPAYSKDPDLQFERPLDLIDDDIARRATYDRVGIPLYVQSHEWQLDTRAALHAFRGLVYALKGKRNSIWVPTFLDDLTPTVNIGAADTVLVVAWTGYATRIAQATNRRDLRIELTNGTVFYRRITASAEAGDTELLTIAALGTGATIAQIRQVSFMGLCRSDSDIAELGWWTGSYADVNTAWRGRKHDV